MSYVKKTALTVGSVPVELIAVNSVRQNLAIQNRGVQSLFLEFDVAASADTRSDGFEIAAGYTWQPVNPPRGEISAICNLGESTKAIILEW